MLFSDELDLRRDLLSEEGVVLLEYTIQIPRVAVECPLGRALCLIADRTEEYLRQSLAERLRLEYLTSNERHKRFTFRRASYRLVCEVRAPSLLAREILLLRGPRLIYREGVLWECSERGLFLAEDPCAL